MNSSKVPKFKKIALIGKSTIRDQKACVKRVISTLQKYGCEIFVDENIAPIAGKGAVELDRKSLLARTDAAITLGGDGTILKTARCLHPTKITPILAVNMGTLGFLSETTPEHVAEQIPRFIAQDYEIDERTLLRVTLYRGGKKIKTSLGLNDAVINQGGFARLIQIKTEIDQRKLTTITADGLIVATPTGSTGHSLSAGGPIVHPKLDALVMSPICPVKLGSRPIIIPNSRQLKMTIVTQRRSQQYIALTIDGQIIWNLSFGDEIKIRKSKRSMHLARFGNRYYKILRQKLGWGE